MLFWVFVGLPVLPSRISQAVVAVASNLSSLENRIVTLLEAERAGVSAARALLSAATDSAERSPVVSTNQVTRVPSVGSPTSATSADKKTASINEKEYTACNVWIYRMRAQTTSYPRAAKPENA